MCFADQILNNPQDFGPPHHPLFILVYTEVTCNVGERGQFVRRIDNRFEKHTFHRSTWENHSGSLGNNNICNINCTRNRYYTPRLSPQT